MHMEVVKHSPYMNLKVDHSSQADSQEPSKQISGVHSWTFPHLLYLPSKEQGFRVDIGLLKSVGREWVDNHLI